MRRPNGYGSISKLSGKRRKPFIVRVHDGWNDNGTAKKKIIGYFTTQAEASKALAEYNADPYDINIAKITLKEVFEKWGEDKFPNINEKSVKNYHCAFQRCKDIENMPMRELKMRHLQAPIKALTQAGLYSTGRKLKSLLNQLYKYAMRNDICDKNYAALLETDGIMQTKMIKKPFTQEEINRLFASQLPYAGIILILIYTGFRVGELLNIKSSDVNTEDWYIRGGSKTAAGINRLVPIHPKVRLYVQQWLDKGNEYLISTASGEQMTYSNFRKHYFIRTMELLDMEHTIHETRHTFATLLNNANANKTSITKLIGHSNFMTTEKIYTHKDIGELRKAIELIE